MYTLEFEGETLTVPSQRHVDPAQSDATVLLWLLEVFYSSYHHSTTENFGTRWAPASQRVAERALSLFNEYALEPAIEKDIERFRRLRNLYLEKANVVPEDM